jgi:hypothetical protein
MYQDEAFVAPSARPRIWPFFVAFAATLLLCLSLVAWWICAKGQDHIASISLNGDGSWYHNYEVGSQIQDPEIFYHNIGTSIGYAREADIIFLGWSRLIFGLDWRVFEAFEQKHRVKMFNMGFADVHSGEFYRLIIEKFGLRPKLWVINTDRDIEDERTGFFFMDLAGVPANVSSQSKARALKNVLGRNLRWRIKMALGLLPKFDSYRSARTGNWWLDNWINHQASTNPTMRPMKLLVADGKVKIVERDDPSCPALPGEIEGARRYLRAIGGVAVLIQVPSIFACAQRVHEIADAVGVLSFTVDPTLFSSNDGGGHLDAVSARKYSTMLFAWLENLPAFQKLFPVTEGPQVATAH